MWNHPEGGQRHLCAERGNIHEKVLSGRQRDLLTPSPFTAGRWEKGIEGGTGGEGQEKMLLLTHEFRLYAFEGARCGKKNILKYTVM